MFGQRSIERKTIAEFANNSAMLVRKVHSTKAPLPLTEEGESAAVVMDSFEYESMSERLQMLEEIYISQEQLRSCKGILHEIVEKELLTRFQ